MDKSLGSIVCSVAPMNLWIELVEWIRGPGDRGQGTGDRGQGTF